jgi:predicted Rdx family selenoprotein
VSATRDLLGTYQHIIDELVLVTGDKGVFDVEVDGEVLFSKRQAGRHAEPGEILERFAALVGPGVARYGT